MKSKSEILATLPNFYGTEAYHKASLIFPTAVLTDVAKYIADACGAYWLMDAIVSYLPRFKDDGFAVARLNVPNSRGSLLIEDGNGNVLAEQEISFTDFPLDSIVLYAVKSTAQWAIMLPSEHKRVGLDGPSGVGA